MENCPPVEHQLHIMALTWPSKASAHYGHICANCKWLWEHQLNISVKEFTEGGGLSLIHCVGFWDYPPLQHQVHVLYWGPWESVLIFAECVQSEKSLYEQQWDAYHREDPEVGSNLIHKDSIGNCPPLQHQVNIFHFSLLAPGLIMAKCTQFEYGW